MESSKKVTTTTAPAATPASKPSVPASVLAAASQYNRLDETDLREARKLGLLLEDLQVSLDSTAPEFGIAYEKKGGTRVAGCAADVFSSQKSLQERCKQFAMQRGFQLFVSGSSTRPNGGGNVKYRCKKLNGQQFFDPDTPASKIQCPFYINGYGKDENWKITRACFLHNHYKFIGWRAAPPTTTHPLAIAAATAVTSGNLPIVSPSTTKLPVLAPAPSVETVVLDAGSSALAPPAEAAMVAPPPRVKAQRNTTMSMKALCRMVTDEVSKCSAPNVAMAKLDGKAIRRILLGQGHTINHMMASRIKRQLQEERLTKPALRVDPLCERTLHGALLRSDATENPR
ncbi:hypothetical protein PC129_g905 [Phytophthora cactorum]|uniref:Uncharacterized protein n=1 Tax=Phytophthora cactorum TaxID=29920 RepID=A0A8T1IU62_9STRA|nr:hypothetical protein PC129_g905 [Phytophthora cactorum]